MPALARHAPDFSTMSLSELSEVQGILEAQMRTKRDADRKAALAKISDVAAEHGFKLYELIPHIPARPDLPVKYRHPNQPELTWCGRGRRPSWMNEAAYHGVPLSAMRVV